MFFLLPIIHSPSLLVPCVSLAALPSERGSFSDASVGTPNVTLRESGSQRGLGVTLG